MSLFNRKPKPEPFTPAMTYWHRADTLPKEQRELFTMIFQLLRDIHVEMRPPSPEKNIVLKEIDRIIERLTS